MEFKQHEIDESLTKQTAQLACLRLTDQEVKEFTPQLKEILNYVEQLKQINVEGVEPMTHPHGIDQNLREDRVLHFTRETLESFEVPVVVKESN